MHTCSGAFKPQLMLQWLLIQTAALEDVLHLDEVSFVLGFCIRAPAKSSVFDGG